jgi:hypothetical protein
MILKVPIVTLMPNQPELLIPLFRIYFSPLKNYNSQKTDCVRPIPILHYGLEQSAASREVSSKNTFVCVWYPSFVQPNIQTQ